MRRGVSATQGVSGARASRAQAPTSNLNLARDRRGPDHPAVEPECSSSLGAQETAYVPLCSPWVMSLSKAEKQSKKTGARLAADAGAARPQLLRTTYTRVTVSVPFAP